MTLARYFVFQHDTTWLVTFEGRVMARLTTRAAALRSARAMASLMGAMHYDADVMLEIGGRLQPALRPARDEKNPKARRHECMSAVLPRNRSLVLVSGVA